MNALALLEKIDAHPLIISKNHKTGEKKGLSYIAWRIKRPLIKFHYKLYKLFNPEVPWLCITAISFFRQYLTKDMKGVEFGSGSSTQFFCKLSGHLVSIEHHEGWFKQVQNLLQQKGIGNVDYRYVPAQEDTKDAVLPDFYSVWDISPEEYSYRKEYTNYFLALSGFEDAYFDYILVDGRARPECLFSNVSKLKSGGLLILDNSERERYTIVFEKLADWPSYTCTSGTTDTTFWIKP